MPRLRSRLVPVSGVLSVIAAVCLVGCHRERPGPPPDVFILLIDTLRADRVGWYGDGRGMTPALDRLAAGGTVFQRAYAASSWTNPSIASLFTSRFPSQHGVSRFESVLAPDELTLAEELAARGYATAGFSANLLIHTGVGFGQGFDTYRIYHSGSVKDRAHRLDTDALAWIDGTRAAAPARPLFVYMHYMEAHEPLQPPRDLLHRLGAARGWTAEYIAALEKLASGAPPLDKMDSATIRLAEDLYDAEIVSLDAEIGRFLAELERRGLRDNAIVVVSSDHGEEFLEHGGVGHGHTLHEELIRVPLLISLPGQKTRNDVYDEVSLVDVAPTLLDVLGGAPPTFEGRSRRTALEGSCLRRMWEAYFGQWRAFSELPEFGASPQRPKTQGRTLVEGRGKVIEHRDGRIEAFDLVSDPHEKNPGALPVGQRDRLVTRLQRTVADLGRGRSSAGTAAIDDETRDRMRALGYDPEN